MRHLGALPDRVLVVEVEPLIEAFGSPMSGPVADQLEAVCEAAVRYETETLLTGIDAVHRTALSKLVALLQSMGGDALMTRLVAEPAIRLLFMSYDVIAVDRRLMAEEALDDVRGHLHANGVDVELIDVAGGVVYVQFHL